MTGQPVPESSPRYSPRSGRRQSGPLGRRPEADGPVATPAPRSGRPHTVTGTRSCNEVSAGSASPYSRPRTGRYTPPGHPRRVLSVLRPGPRTQHRGAMSIAALTWLEGLTLMGMPTCARSLLMRRVDLQACPARCRGDPIRASPYARGGAACARRRSARSPLILKHRVHDLIRPFAFDNLVLREVGFAAHAEAFKNSRGCAVAPVETPDDAV